MRFRYISLWHGRPVNNGKSNTTITTRPWNHIRLSRYDEESLIVSPSPLQRLAFPCASRYPHGTASIWIIAAFVLLLGTEIACAFTAGRALLTNKRQQRASLSVWQLKADGDGYNNDTTTPAPVKDLTTSPLNRRNVLASITLSGLSLVLVPKAHAESSATTTLRGSDITSQLERVAFGTGRWLPSNINYDTWKSNTYERDAVIPDYFFSYATRYLIRYDDAVREWWQASQQRISLLTTSRQQSRTREDFGALARTIQLGLQTDNMDRLWDAFEHSYCQTLQSDGSCRQLLYLFALLPPSLQPTQRMKPVYESAVLESMSEMTPIEIYTLPLAMDIDLTLLLPSNYPLVLSDDGSYSLYDMSLKRDTVELGSLFLADIYNAFGPIASRPLTREILRYDWRTYALFAISGATGCALTHSIVIPLDVIKTRAQTNPGQFSSLLEGGETILRQEGVQGLMLGSQATIAGYYWYGFTVYPTYTFCKRVIAEQLLSPESAIVHVNDIALVAGALAAIVASLGLAPIEAARIRVVAEPETYRALGLSGTLAVIAKEDPVAGWKTLYAGLPPLLTRQVIFGSVKFLAFERACDFLFTSAPVLRDATWTSLGVSLVAGAFSGALSSVVSQPADSVLTYVARKNKNQANNRVGLWTGVQQMVKQDGAASLFRGLGSRIVWAGSIIAGQFLLYDAFRAYFKVTPADLSEIFCVTLPGL